MDQRDSVLAGATEDDVQALLAASAGSEVSSAATRRLQEKGWLVSDVATPLITLSGRALLDTSGDRSTKI